MNTTVNSYLDLSKYANEYKAKLTDQLNVYVTIGGKDESPMWFQFVEHKRKENKLFFRSSQVSYMFFHIDILPEDQNKYFEYKPTYDYFRDLKYLFIKEFYPTVYYQLRPNEKPIAEVEKKPIPISEYKPVITDYQQQAIDFLQSTNCEFSATYLRSGKYFTDDKEVRDIYSITLKRGNRSYTFEFGQSINDSGFYYTKGKQKCELNREYLAKDYFKGKSLGLAGTIKMKDYDFLNNGKSDIIHYPKAPTAYDVLASLQKYDCGTFEDFCSEFGYNEDSKNAEKTYQAVKNEYNQLCTLFTDKELELMQEIN